MSLLLNKLPSGRLARQGQLSSSRPGLASAASWGKLESASLLAVLALHVFSIAWFADNIGQEASTAASEKPVLQISLPPLPVQPDAATSTAPPQLEQPRLARPASANLASVPIHQLKPADTSWDKSGLQQPLALPIESTQTPTIRNYEEHYFRSKELTEKPSVIKDVETELNLALPGAGAQTLVLLLLINEEGDVDRVSLEKADLSQASADTVINHFMRLKFHPGKIDRVAVKSQLKIEVKLESTLPPLHLGGVK